MYSNRKLRFGYEQYSKQKSFIVLYQYNWYCVAELYLPASLGLSYYHNIVFYWFFIIDPDIPINNTSTYYLQLFIILIFINAYQYFDQTTQAHKY